MVCESELSPEEEAAFRSSPIDSSSLEPVRGGSSPGEVCSRLGLVIGQRRYLAYGAAIAIVAVGLTMWMVSSIPPERFLHDGSPEKPFVGLGLGGQAIVMALLYGGVKTGLSEELLFRGLIAGVLGRKLPFWPANIVQALIFLLPHLIIIVFQPSLWWLALGAGLGGGLLSGWLRLKSGSVLAPWMAHATGNITTCLTVAATVTPGA